MRKILILLGALLFLNAASLLIVSNYNLGFIALALVGIFFVCYGVWFEALKCLIWLNVIIITCAGAFLLTSAFLAIYGARDDVTYSNEDCVIVLGAGVHGEAVSLPLARRLDKALELYNAMPELIIIVSGGQGPQESIPESEAMERYLTARGVPAESILQENKATSTLENFQLSGELMRDNSLNSAILITNNFHVYRAARLARYAGITAEHYGAKTEWYTIPVNYIREVLAVWKMWVIPPR